MKYFRNSSHNPILSFTLKDDRILYCYTINDIVKTLCIGQSTNIYYEGVTYNPVYDIKNIKFLNYQYDYLPNNFAGNLTILENIYNFNLPSVKRVENLTIYSQYIANYPISIEN